MPQAAPVLTEPAPSPAPAPVLTPEPAPKPDVKPADLKDLSEPKTDAKPVTVFDKDDGAIKDPEPKTGAFPEDWREQLAGGDEKLLGELKRFKSPKSVVDSWASGRQKIRSGELKSTLPPDADDATKAAWRKEHGLPEKAEDYVYTPPKGMENFKLDDAGKERIGELQKSFFESGATKQTWDKAVEWYNQQVLDAAEETVARDAADMDAFEDAFRTEMGMNFRPAVKQIDTFLVAELGEDLASDIYNARLPDGTLLGNNIGVMRFISKMADHAGTELIDPGQPRTGVSIDQEIAEIEQIMSTNNAQYYNGIAPNSGGKTYQNRLLELYEIKERRSGRRREAAE